MLAEFLLLHCISSYAVYVSVSIAIFCFFPFNIAKTVLTNFLFIYLLLHLNIFGRCAVPTSVPTAPSTPLCPASTPHPNSSSH
jgi:hypothetical protein